MNLNELVARVLNKENFTTGSPECKHQKKERAIQQAMTEGKNDQ